MQIKQNIYLNPILCKKFSFSRSVSSRTPPCLSPSIVRFTILYRNSLRVGWPTAAVIFLTWRFLPSTKVIESQLAGILARNRIGGILLSGTGGGMIRHFAGRVIFFSISTPALILASASASGTPSTCAKYSRSWSFSLRRIWVNFLSFVSNRSPSESKSSLPTG